jgi:hypothetical protein
MQYMRTYSIRVVDCVVLYANKRPDQYSERLGGKRKGVTIGGRHPSAFQAATPIVRKKKKNGRVGAYMMVCAR